LEIPDFKAGLKVPTLHENGMIKEKNARRHDLVLLYSYKASSSRTAQPMRFAN
jgi:hypothetical protein